MKLACLKHLWITTLTLVTAAQAAEILYRIDFTNGTCNTNLGVILDGHSFYDDVACVRYVCAASARSITFIECPKFVVDLTDGACYIASGKLGRYPDCCDHPECDHALVTKPTSPTVKAPVHRGVKPMQCTYERDVIQGNQPIRASTSVFLKCADEETTEGEEGNLIINSASFIIS
ncbi:uncharacterized protein LOC144127591 [Amblyomma americanum]